MRAATAAALLIVASSTTDARSSSATVSSSKLGGADASVAVFVPFTLTEYPYARCLDGSPSGYYFRAATDPTNANDWLFLLDGGGICTTKEDCLNRTHGDLGSSVHWPRSFLLNSTDLTTPNPKNPFAGYNMVYQLRSR